MCLSLICSVWFSLLAEMYWKCSRKKKNRTAFREWFIKLQWQSLWATQLETHNLTYDGCPMEKDKLASMIYKPDF